MEVIVEATYGLRFGDLLSLLVTVDEYTEAIEFDLITLGLRLRDVGTDAFSWRDLYVALRQAPASSALHRAMNPEDYGWNLTEQLLAEVADAVRVANWQRGSAKRHEYPKPIPRPGVKPESQKYGKGALPMDDMAEWLGWN